MRPAASAIAAVLATSTVVIACGSSASDSGGARNDASAGTAGADAEGSGGSAASGGSAGDASASGGAGGSAGSGGGAGNDSSAGGGGSAGSDGGAADAGVKCGSSPLTPGLSNQSVSVGALKRTYELYVPTGLDPHVPAPLVFADHGFTMNGDAMRQLTDYTTLADQEGFVVAFPDGIGTTWNVGTGVCGAGVFTSGKNDDLGFVQAMIDAVDQSQCVDRARVFATGFSMGGYFANDIACLRPDLVRAVAPASGGGPPAGCVAGPTPVMILHGTADPLIGYACGVQARDYWAKHNGCSTDVDTVSVKGGTCEYNKNCPPGGQVVLCSFTGMGHGWAGHVYGLYGGGTQFEDATKLTWDFFKSQM